VGNRLVFGYFLYVECENCPVFSTIYTTYSRVPVPILDCALKIMSSGGYAFLIDHGIRTAAQFASEISKRELFELITEPETNILTYIQDCATM